MRKTFASLAAAAALFCGLAGQAVALDKIKVGVFLSSSALTHFIALNRGFYKDAGLEVETIPLATHPLIVQSIVTGSIDLGTNLVTLEGANINARRPGTLTYISMNGQNAKYITEQFVVKASSPITSLKDLKGAKLFSAPGPANIGAARAVLKAVGLEENKDYTMQEQQLSVHLGALQGGTFDGGYTLEPIASNMIAQGIGKRLEAGVISTYLLGDKNAEAYAAGCALSDTFLKERPEVAARFATAWRKALAVADSDPTAREYLVKDMNVPAALAQTVPLAHFTSVKDMTPAQIQDFQKFIDIGVTLGVVNSKVDVKTMIKPL